jgi:hypothetical protein
MKKLRIMTLVPGSVDRGDFGDDNLAVGDSLRYVRGIEDAIDGSEIENWFRKLCVQPRDQQLPRL